MNPRAYRRPTRIVERKIQPALLVTPADDIMNPTSIIATEPNSLPDLYEIAVQVKLWFFWIDVWAESCAADDADTIDYHRNCADEVANYLTKEV